MTNKERCHRWYVEHKDLVKEKSKVWQQKFKSENRERYYKLRRYNLKKYLQTPKGIYSVIKNNSRVKGRIVPVSQKDFLVWYGSQNKLCYYCEKPQDGKRLSVDRKDNNLPYQLDNIALACDDCNSVKGNILSESEMLEVGKLVMKRRWQPLR